MVRKIGYLPWLLAALLSMQLQAAVVIQYHHISDATPAATSTAPAVFAAHLDYLADNGFQVVPLLHLVALLHQGRPLPDRTVAITFDDGYRSIYDSAFPLLKARGWPFTVFVNSQSHDRHLANFMSWDQVRELVAAGVTIGNHSHSHTQLLRRQAGETASQWEARVTAEIIEAEKRIEAETGQNQRLLAYPYGEFNNALRRLLKRIRYVGFGQQSGPLASYSDLQALPRFPFGGRYGDAGDFAIKVNSLPLPLATARKSILLHGDSGGVLADLLLPPGVTRPKLGLRLVQGFPSSRLTCFASGQGQMPVRVEGEWVFTQAPLPLAVGRSRYNCTAPSAEQGRFYWFSQPWIRKNPDGSWYPSG